MLMRENLGWNLGTGLKFHKSGKWGQVCERKNLVSNEKIGIDKIVV